MEGVTGLVSWAQCSGPRSEIYDFQFAREMMTHDVNAAIRGAKAAGATDVWVKDSHGGSRNLLVHKLEPGTTLVSGYGAGFGGMMTGIDRECCAAMLVGYHGMAGTKAGVMEHTISDYIHRMWINEEPAGEIALSTGLAGCFEVPVVMISSDRAGCDEAKKLVSGIATAETKEGFGKYMGALKHPSETAELIFEAARSGLSHASELDPWHPAVPATVKIEFNHTEHVDMAMRVPGVKRLDGYTLEYSGSSYSEMHQAAWLMFSLSGLGVSAGK